MNRIQEIIRLESEADQLAIDYEINRWETARLIAEELETKSQRQLAREIGKGKTHVLTMARVWHCWSLKRPDERPPFNAVYNSAEVRGLPKSKPKTTGTTTLPELPPAGDDRRRDDDSEIVEAEIVDDDEPRITSDEARRMIAYANDRPAGERLWDDMRVVNNKLRDVREALRRGFVFGPMALGVIDTYLELSEEINPLLKEMAK